MTRDPAALTPSTAGKSAYKPLTAKQLQEHAAWSTNEWDMPPTKSGFCPINKDGKRSGGSFRMWYEIHGSGPIRTVWIMGLGAFRTAWKRQTRYFGHEHGSKYSCLVWDNRGMGLSDKPTCRYSTSEMAKDLLDLLKFVGWMEEPAKRDLNVLGVSMGGMIAQEVGLLIPERIQSLFLISTAARLVRTVPFVDNLRQRINMFVSKDVDVQLDEISHRLFSDEFLALKDTDNPQTNYPTNQDRFASTELAKRQDKTGFTRKGFILQAIAAGWHNVSKQRLKELGDAVGRNRICVMHGTGDMMITFPHFEMLKAELGDGPEYRVWDGVGHVLMWEKQDEFNKAIEGVIERTA